MPNTVIAEDDANAASIEGAILNIHLCANWIIVTQIEKPKTDFNNSFSQYPQRIDAIFFFPKIDNFKTITNFLNAIKRCKIIIKDFDPDIVIGCGGYVTAPVIYAAKKLGKKTFIHEQNATTISLWIKSHDFSWINFS